jgi:hypothetical protein
MIYLDLDGVFVDHLVGFRKVLGWDYTEDPKAARAVLDQVDNLFYKLEPLPGAKDFFLDILLMAMHYKEDVTFLTAAPRKTGKLVTVEYDKTAWVREHLDTELPVIVVPGWRYKKAYSKPGSILVDDSARNIVDWSSRGGPGIVHFDNAVTLKTLHLLLES